MASLRPQPPGRRAVEPKGLAALPSPRSLGQCSRRRWRVPQEKREREARACRVPGRAHLLVCWSRAPSCSDGVRPGKTGRARGTRTPPLRRPQPPATQDQGRRPPSNTSKLNAFSLQRKRELLCEESKVPTRRRPARGASRTSPRNGGMTEGRRKGSESGSWMGEWSRGPLHPLSAL